MPRSSRPHSVPPSLFRVARTSTVDLIAIELRAAIFAGALPVGSSLREVEISEQLGVSRSPLREAAQRLVQEGLLTAVPGRGLRVTEIPPDRVEDVYTARLAVEAQAVRVLARSDGDGVLAAIERAYDELAAVSEGEDAREIGDADLAFHQALVDAAGSPRLSRAMATLSIETRIASLSLPEGYSVRRSVSPTYRKLLRALRKGEVDAAIDASERQFADAVSRLRGEDDSVDTVETDTGEEPQAFQPIVALDAES